VFFTGDTVAEGTELWKTDGTKAGTVLVADIVPGPESSNPYELECVGHTLFFWGTDASGDTELWKSDGTDAGTVRVEEINPNGRAIPLGGNYEPQRLVEVGGRLFFHADDGSGTGVEVWTSDGTEEGTHIVKDIRPGPASSSPGLLTDVDGTLYFAADDGTTGLELWRSNASGTDAERVTDLYPKGHAFLPDPGALFVPLDGALYFGARDGAHGYELWKLPL
jgi:ELWxxDGT repeat protein